MGEKGGAKKMPSYAKYITSGLAGMMATCIVQPLDFAKTRMQVGAKGEYKNAFDLMRKVAAKEGVFTLYNGISAGLFRQASYTTVRMGTYQFLLDEFDKRYRRKPGVVESLAMGTAAGAVGAFVGTPAEVTLIRMMADGKLPEAERRNYKHVGDALIRIFKEEGIFGLWRGCMTTVARAMVVNMAQLSSYTQFKIFYKKFLNLDEGIGLHFCASLSSGFITSYVSLPLDMAKTRIQNMKFRDGVPEYKNSLDVMLKVAKAEGVSALWRGFWPYFFRIGPHTVFTFMFVEQLNKLYYKLVLGGESDSGF